MDAGRAASCLLPGGLDKDVLGEEKGRERLK